MGDYKSLKITEKYWGKFIFYQKTFLENTKYNFGFLKTFTENQTMNILQNIIYNLRERKEHIYQQKH